MAFRGIEYFQELSHYNLWSNKCLYQRCLSLPKEEYHQDRQAFFGSIGNTLNHILVGDQLWLSRFTNKPAPAWNLDAVPYPDRQILWQERQESDKNIIILFESYHNSILDQNFVYQDTEGHWQSIPAPVGFCQFFNHQTHHRGQVHAMISMAGYEPPPLDISYFYFETKNHSPKHLA